MRASHDAKYYQLVSVQSGTNGCVRAWAQHRFQQPTRALVQVKRLRCLPPTFLRRAPLFGQVQVQVLLPPRPQAACPACRQANHRHLYLQPAQVKAQRRRQPRFRGQQTAQTQTRIRDARKGRCFWAFLQIRWRAARMFAVPTTNAVIPHHQQCYPRHLRVWRHRRRRARHPR